MSYSHETSPNRCVPGVVVHVIECPPYRLPSHACCSGYQDRYGMSALNMSSSSLCSIFLNSPGFVSGDQVALMLGSPNEFGGLASGSSPQLHDSEAFAGDGVVLCA